MVGRPSVPDAIKISKGTLRKVRVNKHQPKNSGLPKCPFERGTVAFAKWKEIVAGLKRCGIIDQLDGSMIEAFCTNWQRAKEAEEMLAREGLLIELQDGRRAKHPAATVAAHPIEQHLQVHAQTGTATTWRSSFAQKYSKNIQILKQILTETLTSLF